MWLQIYTLFIKNATKGYNILPSNQVNKQFKMYKTLTSSNLIGKRIKDFFKKRNISSYAIEEKTGISRQTFANFSKRNDISYSQILKISKVYKDFPSVFLKEGVKFNTKEVNKITSNAGYYEIDPSQTDFATAASHHLPFTDQVDYFLLVRFPALLPDIAKGDIIGISELDPDHFIDTSTIYLFTTDSNTFIKRLEPDPDIDGKLWCHSPIYPKFAIEFSAINKIYKVVYRISHL